MIFLKASYVAFRIWLLSGSYDAATFLVAKCPTPVSWVEAVERNEQFDDGHERFWFAVCATSDGKVCGEQVPWTFDECQPNEYWVDDSDDCGP